MLTTPHQGSIRSSAIVRIFRRRVLTNRVCVSATATRTRDASRHPRASMHVSTHAHDSEQEEEAREFSLSIETFRRFRSGSIFQCFPGATSMSTELMTSIYE